MIDQQIKIMVLLELYRAWLSGPSKALALSRIAQELSLEPRIVSNYCRFLAEDGLAELCLNSSDSEKLDACMLNSCGIDASEEIVREDPSPENAVLIKKNRHIRKSLLELFQELREEFAAPHGTAQSMAEQFRKAYYQKIAVKKIDRQSADRNFYYLRDSQRIILNSEFFGGDFYYEVSNSGHELLTEYQVCEEQAAAQQAIVSGYEALKSGSGFTPQERGHALERMLKSILEDEGWQCELNVKTPSQENDLIIHQGREYIIIECKWEESKKASPEYVSRLRDKVLDRPGIRTGVLVSMSGFTEAVADAVRQRLSTCMIILFSGQDVEDIVYGRNKFSVLLDERFHAAMSRTEIIVGRDCGYTKPKMGKRKAL